MAENTHEEGHHHHESFITKYLISHDHKMISKQFLLTAMFMGVIAVILSVLFRLQIFSNVSLRTRLYVLIGIFGILPRNTVAWRWIWQI